MVLPGSVQKKYIDHHVYKEINNVWNSNNELSKQITEMDVITWNVFHNGDKHYLDFPTFTSKISL